MLDDLSGPQRVTEPLYGYRAWHAAAEATLNPLHEAPEWQPGANRATHHGSFLSLPEHAAPMEGCQCGIWMVSSVAELNEYLMMQWGQNVFLHGFLVKGVVRVWGTCIEHEIGWRCEYAQIMAISPTYLTRSFVRSAGWKYDVPVLETDDELTAYKESMSK